MKKILLLLALVPSVALAEFPAVRNDSAATTLQGTNLSPMPLAATGAGKLMVEVMAGDAAIGKIEDAAHNSGGTGDFILGVRNDNASTSFTSTNLDYSPIGVGTSGEVFASPMAAGYASSIAKFEDSPHSSGDGITPIAAVRQDAISSLAGSANDYANLKVDSGGRLIIARAPAGETFQACGTATATTADVQIKAAVALNRHYITSITCKNTSATVATTLDFKDGATTIANGGISQMATTAPGTFGMTFPIPLRGTVNTAINFATNISVSSVTCCAHGYISVL